MTLWRCHASVGAMVRSVAVLAAFALAFSAGAARTEGVASEAVQGMIGGWEISNVDRDRRCPLTFGIEPAPGGFKVELDAGCDAAFPALKRVASWGFGPKDRLQLRDASGAAVMEFSEVESGMFESERGPDGLLFMQTQAALKVEVRSAEQMVGDWALLREADKPLCRLILSDSRADAGDTYRVVVRPGCDKTIAAFGPSTWRLDRDHLILVGRAGIWRFSESDAAVWERVPLSVEPLLLVRQ